LLKGLKNKRKSRKKFLGVFDFLETLKVVEVRGAGVKLLGLKGSYWFMRRRAARLKNFEQRAKSFVQHGSLSDQFARFKHVTRDQHPLRIGVGQHKRLALKLNVSHIEDMLDLEERLFTHLKKHPAEHFQLIKLAVTILPEIQFHPPSMVAVQEYQHKPTLATLADYFFLKEGKPNLWGELRNMKKEDYFLAKQFARQHRGITLEKLKLVKEELWNATHKASHLNDYGNTTNVLVLGLNHDGKLRIALVDV
jgi:hypothetical protein